MEKMLGVYLDNELAKVWEQVKDRTRALELDWLKVTETE
jgi:hypothetical protein